MNTDQIAYFIDIAKTGSINTTAKRMFSSQQAVSDAIKRMEQELGCTILERSKRGVSLTDDGKYVLQQVLPIMKQYQILQQHFQQTDTPSENFRLVLHNLPLTLF
ncbi:MAG: LysR family transcriptional regulator [Peptococcaceae bacterium]|nr:LysR family transcriptional regulator [Peptococcaceae bacterium]